METMKEFVGNRLTHGAFHQMNCELLSLIAGNEALLKLETLTPPIRTGSTAWPASSTA